MRAQLGLIIAGGLLAAACSGGTGSSDGADVDDGRATGGRPVPVESALEVVGTAELTSDVLILPLDRVMTMGESATTLTVDALVSGLEIGVLFVVPGVASGRVTSIEAADGGVQRVHFEQPSVGELFETLDVTFAGRPDPARVHWETDEATAAGEGATIEYLELGALEDLPDPDEPADVPTASSADATPDAGPGSIVRVAAPSADDDQENESPADACRPSGVESSTDQALAVTGTQEFSAKADAYEVSVRHRLDGACGTHYFKINTTRNDSLALTGSAFGWVNSEYVEGAMVLEGDSVRSTVELDVSGELWFSVAGQVKEPLTPSGVKISYDLVKKDIPVVIGGVPFLVRLGVPLIMEARLPSVGDTLTATLVHLSCEGRFGTSGEGTPDSTCTAAPITPHIAESFGPMAFIVATGFKAGFGPGVSIPMSQTTRNVVYAGATATLSSSTGLTRSGTAGAPLIDCVRIDRSVQFNLGAEAQVLGLTVGSATNVWKKAATDHWGRRCPESEMSG